MNDQRKSRSKPGIDGAKGMKTGNKDQNRATMKDMEQLAERAGLELHDDSENRRVYRKAADLPDPSKSHRAEVNRRSKIVNFRLGQEQIDQIDKLATARGLSRSALLAEIVLQTIDQAEISSQEDCREEPKNEV